MKTNSFELLTSLKIYGDWNITIRAGENGQFIVSVMLSKEDIGDKAARLVPPMLFKGTVNELDEEFFQALTTPAQQTSCLFMNMAQFAKDLEMTKKNSRMEEENNRKEKSEKEDRRKKLETQMKKVAELEEKQKWGEAIGAMPKIEHFPEQAEEIKKKIEELRKKHGHLQLFS